MGNTLNIALSKGRILEECLPLLAQAGVVPLEDPNQSRKLILDTNQANIKLTIIRATDVPTYVQYGAADLGVVGKDVLMEYEGEGLYELLDLKIAKCRLMVAEPISLAEKDDPKSWTYLRIATKYTKTAQRHFANKGIQTDIIKLYGSMELAPLVGLSDRIVDLISTGKTLKANGLIEVEHITNISSWLVVNKASMRLKHDAIKNLVQELEKAVV